MNEYTLRNLFSVAWSSADGNSPANFRPTPNFFGDPLLANPWNQLSLRSPTAITFKAAKLSQRSHA
jgi:hypothetical protein